MSEVRPADESEFDTKELWEATEPPTPLSRSPLWLTLCHLAHARPTMHSIPLVIIIKSWKKKFGSTVIPALMIPYDTIHICMHRGSCGPQL